MNADCLDYLSGMESGSVDCVVTDCPYKIMAGGTRVVDLGDEPSGVLSRRDYSKTDPKGVLSRGRMIITDGTPTSARWVKKDGSIPSAVRDGKMFAHNDIEFDQWLPEVYRVLKPGTHCYVMINSRNLKNLQVDAEAAGFAFQNLLVWDKRNQTPNKYYMQAAEFVLMLSKRPARNINDMGSSTVLRFPNVRNKRHPTQKPVALFAHLIGNSTDRGDLVLDPFAGVGTAEQACRNSGRRCISIEIDSEFCAVAEELLAGPASASVFGL